MQLNTGSTLQGGKYRIIKSLGQGGFGITYLAEQVMMERKVCISYYWPIVWSDWSHFYSCRKE